MYDFGAASFEWDEDKNRENQDKHGISFEEAQRAFADPRRVVSVDETHSTAVERRYFCIGEVDGGIMTVRFTWRHDAIRIYGAGFWRKQRRTYEEQNGQIQ